MYSLLRKPKIVLKFDIPKNNRNVEFYGDFIQIKNIFFIIECKTVQM